MEKQYKVPKEITEKWLAALRSGEYKQGLNYLFEEEYDQYCCMGVLGCLLGTPKHEMNGNSNSVIEETIIVIPDQFKFYGDKKLRTIETITYELIKMNDSGKTFLEIADYIEENCELI